MTEPGSVRGFIVEKMRNCLQRLLAAMAYSSITAARNGEEARAALQDTADLWLQRLQRVPDTSARLTSLHTPP